MRISTTAAVLCFAAVPALGDALDLEFDVTSGTITFYDPNGLVLPDCIPAGMDGTFGVTVYASNGHIGESDTFILTDSDLYNTDEAVVSLQSLITVTIGPQSAHFLDFAPVAPGHIGPGGVGTISTDVYMEAILNITGLMDTPFTTHTWNGEPLDLGLIITTSVNESDVVQATLHGTFFALEACGTVFQTMTINMVIDVVGTAHVTPDPALGGLTLLGLVGASAWLRRRRTHV